MLRSLTLLSLLSSSCGIIAGLDDKQLPSRSAGGSAGAGSGAVASGGTSGEAGTGESGTSSAGAGHGGTAGGAGSGGKGGLGASGGKAGAGATAGKGGSSGSSGTGGAPVTECEETLPRNVDTDLTVGPGCVRVVRTTVGETATLTVAPGTTMRMEYGAFLDTVSGGALHAVGTPESPILFTSAATAPVAGDWQCVRLGGEAPRSELRHVTMEYGGAPCAATAADDEGTLQLATRTPAVTDSTFRHSLSHGVLLERDGAVDEFQDNVFGDNGAASINVAAPQLFALGTGLVFADEGDRIDVTTTFSLQTGGTWRAQPVAYRLDNSLEIAGSDVTIEAGTRVEVTTGSIIVFDSNLSVAGTEDAPVTFTSARTPAAPGDWGCITAPGGTQSFDHAVIEFAGSGSLCSGAEYETALHVPESAVVTNTTFRSIAGSGITARACNLVQWCENTFESVETGPLACDTGQMPTACP